MLCHLLLLLLLAQENICSAFQPETARLPWVGSKLRLALRQAKRNIENPEAAKLYNPGKAWKPVAGSDNVEADEENEIAGSSSNSGNFSNPGSQLERVGEAAEHLVQMIKSLKQAIEAKQMMEPKLKRPKIDGRIRILKVCIKLMHAFTWLELNRNLGLHISYKQLQASNMELDTAVHPPTNGSTKHLKGCLGLCVYVPLFCFIQAPWLQKAMF